MTATKTHRQARAQGSLRINARLPATLAVRVQRLSEQDGQTMTDIVAAALDLYCKTNESRPTALEAFASAGLIGAVDWDANASTTIKSRLTRGLAEKLTRGRKR